MEIFIWKFFILVSSIFSSVSIDVYALKLINYSNGKVGPGNFSYFKLEKSGDLRIVLETIEGDADLYVSSAPGPNYSSYDFKSTTYGDEVIDITSSVKRPVYIGVFGHPVINDESSFVLKIFDLANLEEDEDVNEEGSIIWIFLVDALHLILNLFF